MIFDKMTFSMLINPYTFPLLFALFCLGGLCMFLPFAKFISAGRIRVISVAFLLILFSYPFVVFFARSESENVKENELPRFAPLVLSAQLISGSVNSNNVLIVSKRGTEWIDMGTAAKMQSLFPYVKQFAIQSPDAKHAGNQHAYHYILLDCGSSITVSNIFHCLSFNALMNLKKCLHTENGILIVLLPGQYGCDDAITRNVMDLFHHVMKLNVGEMNFLLASDNPNIPITDINTINSISAYLHFYDNNGLPDNIFSIILGPLWRNVTLPDLRQIKKTTSYNPVLLRIMAGHTSPLRVFLTRFGKYCWYALGFLFFLYLTVRYFFTGVPVRKKAFRGFELMFLTAIAFFCVQYMLAFINESALINIWPLVCSGILLLLEFFVTHGRPICSRKKKIFCSLMSFSGAICLFSPVNIICLIGIFLFIFPILYMVFSSSYDIADTAGAKSGILQAALGFCFALITIQILIFLPYGPGVLIVLITLMTAFRLRSIPES